METKQDFTKASELILANQADARNIKRTRDNTFMCDVGFSTVVYYVIMNNQILDVIYD